MRCSNTSSAVPSMLGSKLCGKKKRQTVMMDDGPKKPTRVAASSPRASLGRRTVCGSTEQGRPPVWKRYETKVRMVWGSFIFAAAALITPTRNGYNAEGVKLNTHTYITLFSSIPASVIISMPHCPVEPSYTCIC